MIPQTRRRDGTRGGAGGEVPVARRDPASIWHNENLPQRDSGAPMAIRTGIGGWTFAPWRGGVFYPAGLPQAKELHYASRQVRTIEINGTFYRNPTLKACADWGRQAPEDFVFALKAPRAVVARRVLAEAEEGVRRFLDSGIVELGAKLGPINWQLAPTRRFDAGDLSAFLALLPDRHQGVALRHALEVRHPSFVDAAFVALARRHGVGVVHADHETYPALADVTARFVYARLMRARPDVESGYDAAALVAWAAAAEAWARGETPAGMCPVGADDSAGPAAPADAGPGAGRDVFVYFINGAKARAPAGAMALQRLLERAR